MLSFAEKRELLSLARNAVEACLGDAGRGFSETSTAGLKIGGGAFVSLHRGDELRGCIGRILSSSPLYLTVQEMAVAAATQDFRFPALRPEELPEIDIEISVLSVPREISGVGEIRVGEHGIIVRSGASSGLLLPQVATEYGWDAPTFLSHTCVKAGLAMDFWKWGQPRIEAFTAEVFSEKSLGRE